MNNKKVAIISAYNYNYGTVLQATALIKVLNKYVHDITVLDYKKRFNFNQVKRIINRTLFMSKINVILKNILLNITMTNRKYVYEKNRKFLLFLNKNIHFSKTINGYQELKEKIKTYDEVLLGSDQLWNPINIGTHYFTLEFVPDNIIKNTYATSFGVTKLTKREAQIMKKCIERIDNVSVREVQAKELILKSISKKNIEVCLDPTLLLNQKEWNQIIPPQRLVNNKYILAYFVGDQKKYRTIVSEFARLHGYEVMLIPHVDKYVWSDRPYMNGISMSAGPEEFVNLVRYAEYVFTDSFHGCIFSIIFQKEFFPFARFKSTNRHSMNSRLESLFLILGIKDRWIKQYKDIENVMKDRIDYDLVYDLLREKREYSINYIKRLYVDEGSTIK